VGLWGALKLPQREPGRQSFSAFVAIKYSMGGANALSVGTVIVRPLNMQFHLKMKSLAMTEFEVTLLIHVRPFHVLPHPSLPESALTAARECSLP